MFRLTNTKIPKPSLNLHAFQHRISKKADKLYNEMQLALDDRFKFNDAGAILVIRNEANKKFNIEDVNSTARLAYRYKMNKRCDVIQKDTLKKLVTVFRQKGDLSKSDKDKWIISTSNINASFPHHYRNLSDPNKIYQETGHKNISKINHSGTAAEATSLKSAVQLAHKLLPHRNDLLNRHS